MKRLLALALLSFVSCSTTSTNSAESGGLVRQARINIPQEAYVVEGSNPRRWNQPMSFGPWRTTTVSESAARSWLSDLGVLEVARMDQAYRLTLAGESGTTYVECHTRELVVGRSGVFLEPTLGNSPILVCGLQREGQRAVLALTRTGAPSPLFRGELRQIGGSTYDVRSIHHADGQTLPSAETFGYEIVQESKAVTIVETVNRGRVWIDPAAPNREAFAAASAALLLFRDPDAASIE